MLASGHEQAVQPRVKGLPGANPDASECEANVEIQRKSRPVNLHHVAERLINPQACGRREGFCIRSICFIR